jgi:hypothetical protein
MSGELPNTASLGLEGDVVGDEPNFSESSTPSARVLTLTLAAVK